MKNEEQQKIKHNRDLKETNLHLIKGRTHASATPALLRWTDNNTIQLFTVDHNDTVSKENLISDVKLTEINKVYIFFGSLIFKIDGKKYRLEFSDHIGWRNHKSGTGKTYAVEFKAKNTSELNWWITELKKHNVNVSNYSFLMVVLALILIALISTIALLGFPVK